MTHLKNKNRRGYHTLCRRLGRALMTCYFESLQPRELRAERAAEGRVAKDVALLVARGA